MPQVLEEALLIYVESEKNSNKFYRLRLHDDDTVHKLWGRVPSGVTSGLTGQQLTENGGRANFEKTLKGKIRKGYTRADIVTSTTPAPSNTALHVTASASLAGGSDDPVVQTLVDRLVAANKHNLMSSTGGMITVDVTGQARTALGVISARAVADARALLNEMTSATDDAERALLTEKYLRLVPQAIPVSAGRGWAARWLFEHTSQAKQRDLLDALDASASYAAASKANAAKAAAGDIDEDFFRYRVTRLDPSAEEYQMVMKRFDDTKQTVHAATYRMKPKYIYRLEDRGHGADVLATAERIRNVQKLWHGTGAANVLSILQKGLFVPDARRSGGIHIAGRMFGDGVYLSKSATKSLNYSTGFWGGGGSTSTFMFLTQTAMGYEYRPKDSHARGTLFVRPDADRNGKRYDSVNVLPGTAGVINHEAIVTDPMQVNLQWLVEF